MLSKASKYGITAVLYLTNYTSEEKKMGYKLVRIWDIRLMVRGYENVLMFYIQR